MTVGRDHDAAGHLWTGSVHARPGPGAVPTVLSGPARHVPNDTADSSSDTRRVAGGGRGQLTGTQIHAARFGRSRLHSVLALGLGDRTWVSHGRAVAVTTELGHVASAGGWWGAGVLGGLSLLSGGAGPTALTGVVVLLVAVGWWAPRLERQWRGRREHDVDDGPWLLTDVAAVPGTGGGDAVLAHVAAGADDAGRRLVLAVEPANQHALDLYERHGFSPTGNARGRLLRERRPQPADGDRQATTRVDRCFAIAATLSVATALTLLWDDDPRGWLMPIAASLAVAAAATDLSSRRIPNALTGIGAVTTAIVGGLVVANSDVTIVDLLGGAALFAGPLLAANLATAGRTPGLGDVKLATVLGAVLGTAGLVVTYLTLLAVLATGAVFGLAWQRRTGERGFPLAPGVAAATCVALAIAAPGGPL
jgi:Flp pilus assembly protein protease CpaA